MNNAAVNMGMQKSEILFWILLHTHTHTEVRLPDHMVILYLIFWESALLFSTSATPFYIPTSIAQGVPISPHPCQLLLFLLIAILMWWWVSVLLNDTANLHDWRESWDFLIPEPEWNFFQGYLAGGHCDVRQSAETGDSPSVGHWEEVTSCWSHCSSLWAPDIHQEQSMRPTSVPLRWALA